MRVYLRGNSFCQGPRELHTYSENEVNKVRSLDTGCIDFVQIHSDWVENHRQHLPTSSPDSLTNFHLETAGINKCSAPAVYYSRVDSVPLLRVRSQCQGLVCIAGRRYLCQKSRGYKSFNSVFIVGSVHLSWSGICRCPRCMCLQRLRAYFPMILNPNW